MPDARDEPRAEMVDELVNCMRDCLTEFDDPYSAAELLSACMTFTAHAASVMLAMSSPESYTLNLASILKGLKHVETMINPSYPGAMN